MEALTRMEPEEHTVQSAFKTETFEIRTLEIDNLARLDAVQPRKALNEEAVETYRNMMEEGTVFDEVVAFWDGKRFILASGFHRVEAALRSGRKEIDVEVREGSQHDAFLFACGANARHGVRYTNEDKRRMAGRLLESRHKGLLRKDTGKDWSDHDIARHIGVTQPFISGLRQQLYPQPGEVSNGRRERTLAAVHPESGTRLPMTRSASEGRLEETPDMAAADAAPEEHHWNASGPVISAAAIAEGVAAQVLGYFRQHCGGASVAVYQAALSRAVPMIEAGLETLHAE